VSNYSTLLLSEDKDVLYVGAREVIFALNTMNIAEKQHEVCILVHHSPFKNHTTNLTEFPGIGSTAL